MVFGEKDLPLPLSRSIICEIALSSRGGETKERDYHSQTTVRLLAEEKRVAAGDESSSEDTFDPW